MAGAEPLLAVEDLTVSFGPVEAVRGVSWGVSAHETLVLLGESGSGKTVSLHAVAGLLPGNARVGGSLRAGGEDLTGLSSSQWRRFRAERYGMVFQDPMSALNPCFSAGDHLAEILRVHRGLSRADAWQRAVDLLETVRIPDPARRAKQYPHELSGGMRQRVMIAMAIALDPPLLLADEPTTALDTSVRGAILETLQALREELGMGMVLITHDIGVAAATADRIAVMYAGKVVEHTDAAGLLRDPAHPYTAALLGSLPRLGRLDRRLEAIPGTPPAATAVPPGCAFHPRCRFAEPVCTRQVPALLPVAGGHDGACHLQERLRAEGALDYWRAGEPVEHPSTRPDAEPYVRVEGLVKEYALGKGTFRAVDTVSFSIPRGTTLGIVGESGSGKSTTAMILCGLTAPTAGRVQVGGDDLLALDRAALRRKRRDIQVVFQDPHSSLDPRMSVQAIVSEPLLVHDPAGKPRRGARVAELLDLVGLDGSYAERYPHQLSGGQAQRVSIARALALEPALLILDEPVASLDLSIQAQILNLLRALQRRLDLTYVFIGHDLAAVAYVSDRVAVMRKGVIEELDDVEAIYQRPASGYTRMLLDAVLDPERDLGRLSGAAVRRSGGAHAATG
jgi:peptide/nickel transport system ATP-binding protein